MDTSELIVITISFLITIVVMVFKYERKLRKLNSEKHDTVNLLSRMSKSWNEMIFNQKVLMSILEDDYSNEEIENKYVKKRIEMEMDLTKYKS